MAAPHPRGWLLTVSDSSLLRDTTVTTTLTVHHTLCAHVDAVPRVLPAFDPWSIQVALEHCPASRGGDEECPAAACAAVPEEVELMVQALRPCAGSPNGRNVGEWSLLPSTVQQSCPPSDPDASPVATAYDATVSPTLPLAASLLTNDAAADATKLGVPVGVRIAVRIAWAPDAEDAEPPTARLLSPAIGLEHRLT